MRLIINAGSATVKYAIFEGEEKKIDVLIEILGKNIRRTLPALLKRPDVRPLLHGKKFTAIAFRFVHGGDQYRKHVRLTPKILKNLKALDRLAPLHNPFARKLVEETQRFFPSTKKYLIFDTAFHSTLPERSWRYALPKKLANQNHLRRYGFHGIVCSSLVRQLRQLGKLPQRLIICHLGGGCSITAVNNGKSIDTSMGFTPLEGLVMGTRAGDLDPGLLLHLEQVLHMKPDEVFDILQYESGLKALAGTNDMRKILRDFLHGNENSHLAFEIFCYKAAKTIASYIVSLGGLDMLVFSGGIGENAPLVRAGICEFLRPLGIFIHPKKNAKAVSGQFFHQFFSKVKLCFLHADEEDEMNRWLLMN